MPPHYPTRLKIIIEVWQALFIISLMFFLASGVLFFGAVLPRKHTADIFIHNNIKVQSYADYSDTKSFTLDTVFEFERLDMSCKHTLLYQPVVARNQNYLDILKTKEATPDYKISEEESFYQLSLASDNYTQALTNFLETQNRMVVEYSNLLNEFQEYCWLHTNQIYSNLSDTKLSISHAQEVGVTFPEQWIQAVDDFTSLVALLESDTLRNYLEVDTRLQEVYNSIFALSLDFSSLYEGVTTAEKNMLQALEKYEYTERAALKELNIEKELLFFTS